MDFKKTIPPIDTTMASLTAIVIAYLERHEVSPSELLQLVEQLKHVLQTGQDIQKTGPLARSRSQISSDCETENSIQENYLICLEDGKRFKSLKRHLQAKYNMTPDDYRQKWNLSADYPMVAPAYSRARAAIARSVGLGITITKPSKTE